MIMILMIIMIIVLVMIIMIIIIMPEAVRICAKFLHMPQVALKAAAVSLHDH